MANDTQDIYAEVTLKGIRDGAVWSGPMVVAMPNQSKASYTVIENELMEVLKKFGAMSLAVEGQAPKRTQ